MVAILNKMLKNIYSNVYISSCRGYNNQGVQDYLAWGLVSMAPE